MSLFVYNTFMPKSLARILMDFGTAIYGNLKMIKVFFCLKLKREKWKRESTVIEAANEN